MEQHIHSTINAYLIRGAFYVLLLLGVSITPSALAQRNATKQSVANLGSGADYGINGDYEVTVLTRPI